VWALAGQERDINIGASEQSKTAALASQGINRDIFAQQTKYPRLSKTGYGTDARRSNLEQIRNEQRARSLFSLHWSFSRWIRIRQRFFSAGRAYGGISGQSQTNLLNNQQALATGENVFRS